MTSSQRDIYRLLAKALSDLGSMNWEEQQSGVMEFTGTMSRLAEQLEQATHGGPSYEQILEGTMRTATDEKMSAWLANSVKDLRTRYQQNDAAVLHGILTNALLQLRMTAYEMKNENAYRIADIVHNAPQQLIAVLKGQGSYQDVLVNLRQRAARVHMDEWIDNSLRQ